MKNTPGCLKQVGRAFSSGPRVGGGGPPRRSGADLGRNSVASAVAGKTRTNQQVLISQLWSTLLPQISKARTFDEVGRAGTCITAKGIGVDVDTRHCIKRSMVGGLAAAALPLVTSLLPGISASALTASATAAPCPDTEVVFARGTGEPPGPGPTGDAFIGALHNRVGDFAVYPVNYPASDEWSTGVEGIRDAANHIVNMANNCPQTKMVLGGYSQGAAVMGFVTSPAVPDGVDPATVPKPLRSAWTARCPASVVLPEPPFWEATAITCMDPLQNCAGHAAVRV